MRVRKLLGGVVNKITGGMHSVAKLENGLYAVGDLSLGQRIYAHLQFQTLSDACKHWAATLPFQNIRSQSRV